MWRRRLYKVIVHLQLLSSARQLACFRQYQSSGLICVSNFFLIINEADFPYNPNPNPKSTIAVCELLLLCFVFIGCQFVIRVYVECWLVHFCEYKSNWQRAQATLHEELPICMAAWGKGGATAPPLSYNCS